MRVTPRGELEWEGAAAFRPLNHLILRKGASAPERMPGAPSYPTDSPSGRVGSHKLPPWKTESWQLETGNTTRFSALSTRPSAATRYTPAAGSSTRHQSA